jgi:NADH:ubiquinone oxidoreductase subunit F (NADH-binding)
MIAEKRIVLNNLGKINPESIDDYISAGGYLSAGKALGRNQVGLIEDILKSGLRGRGGAGFPVGRKMQSTAGACPHCFQKYVVCNADEGEPGTFKDRIIMENDPHKLIEGIIIASYAVGATMSYIYLRGEYFRSIILLSLAIKQAREMGFLGSNIFGSGFSLDIEIKKGAGSYLCGEELTLIESLEGKRGNPRIKPPFPAERGLFGAPTLVNNVETLACLPSIIAKGPEWFSALGTKSSTGTKIFTISGDVNIPGFFEVEMGTTLRQLIFGLAGGIAGGKKIKAALVGGAAGTFVNESLLDTPADFDSLKAKGAVLGSGAIIVMNEDRSLLHITLSLLEFFKHESCGKCVPCRVGTTLLVNMMNDIIENEGHSAYNLEKLVFEADYMAGTSLCPLGQSPVLPVRSLMRLFNSGF